MAAVMRCVAVAVLALALTAAPARATACASGEFEATPAAGNASAVCSALAVCVPGVSFEAVAPTATSDRQCTAYVTADRIVLTIASSRAAFNTARAAFEASLSDLFSGGTAFVISSTTATTTSSARRRRALGDTGALEVRVVVANATTLAPLSAAEVLVGVNAEAARTGGDCFSQAELDCQCTTDGLSNGQAVSNDCVDVGGVDSCFVAGGTQCSSATDANAVNAAFPAGSGSVPCPSFHPQIPNCLERRLDFFTSAAALDSDASVNLLGELPAGVGIAFNNSVTDSSVTALASMARLFRDTIQPEPLPLDAINHQIQFSDANDGELDEAQAQTDAQEYFLPFVVISAVSVLATFFFPLVAAIVGCCRCCRCCCCYTRCGGGPRRRPKASSKCSTLAQVFFLGLVSLAVALCAVGLLRANDKLESSVDDTELVLLGSIDAVELFRNSTFDQVEAIADLLIPSLTTGINAVVDSVNADVTFGLQRLIQNATDGLIQAMVTFDAEARRDSASLAALQADLDTLTADTDALDTALAALTSEASTLQADCNTEAAAIVDGTAQATAQAICDAIPTTAFTVLLSFAVDLSAIQTNLQAVVDSDLAGLAAEANRTFADLPETTSNKTEEARRDINSALDEFRDTIRNETRTARADSDEVLYADFDPDAKKADISELFQGDTRDQFSQLKLYVTQGFAGAYIAVGVLAFLAVLAGICNTSTDEPYEPRSGCARCGGRSLQCTVVAMVALSFVTNLVVLILFLVGALTGETCEVVVDGSLIAQVADNPDNWGGEFPLATAVLDDATLVLTATSILEACRADQGIWTALQLDLRTNLTEELDADGRFNVSAQLSAIDLGDVDIIPADTNATLQGYRDSGLAGLNFTELGALLNASLLDADLGDYAAQAASTEAAVAGNADLSAGLATQVATWRANADQAEADLAAIDDQRNTTRSTSFAELEASSANLEARVDAFAAEVDGFEAFFQATAANLLDVPAIEADVLALIEDFVQVVSNSVRTQLGNCKVLTDVYDGLVQSTCVETQAGLDAYWLALALLAFLTFPFVVLAMRVARYFLRELDYEDEPGKGMGYPLALDGDDADSEFGRGGMEMVPLPAKQGAGRSKRSRRDGSRRRKHGGGGAGGVVGPGYGGGGGGGGAEGYGDDEDPYGYGYVGGPYDSVQNPGYQQEAVYLPGQPDYSQAPPSNPHFYPTDAFYDGHAESSCDPAPPYLPAPPYDPAPAGLRQARVSGSSRRGGSRRPSSGHDVW